MEHDFLDRYSRMSSPVHRLPASAKLVAALAIVVFLTWVPRGEWVWLQGAAVLLLAVTGLAGLPWGFVIRRLLFAELFVVGVAVMALLQPDGLRLFLFLVAKSTLCLLTMVLLANTTPFAELLRVLKAARVPALLVTTLSLMYRYMFVLLDESQRMRRARLSRTFTARQARSWRTRASVLGQLFIRSGERAERIYGAMCARGWR
jgi:cobalt/nickel transport system permease protein